MKVEIIEAEAFSSQWSWTLFLCSAFLSRPGAGPDNVLCYIQFRVVR